jgi:hypothetical protein
MPPKKIKKARQARVSRKPAVTDLHSGAAHANFQDVFRFHGEQPRGLDFPPGSPLFEGRFGRMFRTLPAAEFDEDDLKELARRMVAKPEREEPNEQEDDPEENQGISAGYTYLGQFIDHDLTYDPASSLQKQNDPEALEDFRTPRFDLDCLYGRGPNDQPYLYVHKGSDTGVHMLLGRALTGNRRDRRNRRTHDLPRYKPLRGGSARALIGDPRNDENVIISQLHQIMLRFHNRTAEVMKKRGGKLPDFGVVQNAVRWHYQWVVLDDFLRTIVGDDPIHAVLPHLKNKTSMRVDKPNLTFFHWENFPFMPIEFSAAVYRFGHSMVRPQYRLNTTLRDLHEIFSAKDPENSLVGFREFPSNFAVDWSLFFHMGDAPHFGKERLQKSYKIDTSLVNPLGKLPKEIGDKVPSLALRNLIRGWRMGLPSGQSVARYMGYEPIPDRKLKVGKATEEDGKKNKRLTEISARFRGNAPLWYYVLAEAQQAFEDDATPIRLGPVGGRIVAEVFIGLLLGDQYSFLSQYPSWRPFKQFTADGTEEGKFGMAELIKQAMKA